MGVEERPLLEIRGAQGGAREILPFAAFSLVSAS
jgi:hypothetical protein